MKAAVLLALAALAAFPASAQIQPSSTLGDPRVMAEQGRAAADARAAAAAAQSRQTELTTQNLRIDRDAPPTAGVRDAQRAELARRRLEAAQAEDAERLAREDRDRARLQRIDPAAAPRR